MSKMEIKMLKVRNAKIIAFAIIAITFLNLKCVAQKGISLDRSELAYDLINLVFKKKPNGSLYNLTTATKDSSLIRNACQNGLANFIVNHNDLPLFACSIDSLFSRKVQDAINQDFKSLQQVKLNSNNLQNPKILNQKLSDFSVLDYGGKLDEAVYKITFPQIFIQNNIIYGIFIEESPSDGLIYIYRKKKKTWKQVCVTTLYFI